MPELPKAELTPADLEAAYRAVWAITPDEDLARGVWRFIQAWQWELHSVYASGSLRIQHPWPLDLIVAIKLNIIQFRVSRCTTSDECAWAMAAGHTWLRDGTPFLA